MIKITLLDIVIKITLIGKDLMEIHICKCNDENYLDRKYLNSCFSTLKKPCTIKWACTLNSIRNIIRPVCLLGAVRLIDIRKKSNLYAYLQLYVYSGLKSSYIIIWAHIWSQDKYLKNACHDEIKKKIAKREFQFIKTLFMVILCYLFCVVRWYP